MHKIVASFALLLAAASAQAAIPSTQRDALIAIYQSTNGANWNNRTNWLGAAGTECTWHGVGCDEQQANVTDLELYDNNLTGSIPAAIGNLPRLRNLQLYGNNLEGPLPPQLGQLNDLEVAYFDRNRISGTIPSTIGALKNLRILEMDGNLVEGPLPAALGDLSALETLELSYNAITGPIPKELGKLTNLKSLGIGVNQLSGSIPSELGQLRNLESLELVDNDLEGPIPPRLGDLAALKYLRLSYNQLTGPFPAELGLLHKLEHLAIEFNRLSGHLPGAIAGLSSIKFFSVYGNDLQGALPPDLFSLTTLEELHLGSNHFAGPLSGNIGRLVNLQKLGLSYNGFTGTLPPQLTTLTKLTSLELLQNQFEGPIPSDIDRLTELTYIDFADNRFSGAIPSQLGALTKLEVLHLYQNQLEGTIPAQLGQLTNLHTLTLASNRLGGAIPDALRSLTKLRQLALDGNQLIGSIPSWIGELTQLGDLNLAYNQLTGTIPAGLATLEQLFVLDISNNQIGGALPDFSRLRNLAHVDFGSNLLSGPIPASIGTATNLINLNLGHNALTGPLPREIGQLSKVEYFDVSTNMLEGPIPPEIGGLTSAYNLSFDVNRFSGTIPREIGQLSQNLQYLGLSFNALRGPIPREIMNLTRLEAFRSHFFYNALFTNDADVRAFVNSKEADNGDFEATQTVTPTNVRVTQTTDRSATLQWTPIRYNANDGGYQVLVSTSPGGAPVAVATTLTKDLDSITIRNLQPSTSYFFTVSAVSHPFDVQENLLVSDPSGVLQATTGQRIVAPAEVVITQQPEGMVQIDGQPRVDDSFTLTNFGDTASQIVLERSDDFFTVQPASFTIAGGASQVVTLKSVPQPAGTYYGSVAIQGAGVVPADDPNAYLVLLSVARPSGIVIAEPLASRVEVAGAPGSDSVGTAQFRNVGTAPLTGIIVSDQPWVVPRTEPITIEPGGVGTVNFTIRRSRRPAEGALTANLSLVYVDGTAGAVLARLRDFDPHGSSNSGISVSKVTVVDTTKPPVTSGSVPSLAAGELPYFIVGALNRNNLRSDVSIVNAAGASSIGDLKLYFTSGSTTNIASLQPLGASQSVSLANIVGNVYGSTNTIGTLQVRSGEWQSVGADAKFTAVTPGGGTLSGAMPVFRGDRGTATNQSIYLPGVAKPTDIVVQDIGGVATTIRIQFRDANGNAPPPIERTVAANGLLELTDIVPAGAVTAILTNITPSSNILAYARVTDAASGDTWSVVDWSSFYRYSRGQPVRVPFVDGRQGGGGKRRSVPHATAARGRTDVALFNATPDEARATLQVIAASGSVSEKQVTIAPNATLVVSDAGSASGSSTAHLIVTPTRGELAVTARSHSANVGTAIPILAATAGLRLGQSQIFSGLADSTSATVNASTPATFRTSYGLVETSGASVRVRARITIDEAHALVTATTSRTFDLAPRQQIVLPELLRSFAGNDRDTAYGDLHDLTLEIEVIEGSGSVVPFLIVTDNGTGDSLLRIQ